MTNLTPAEIANSPSIRLGGERFFIPKLALKQNRIVVDRLRAVLPAMSRVMAAAEAVKAGGPLDGLIAAFPMDGDTIDKVADAVYAAITRANPDFTRAQFDDLPMGIDELLLAVPTIMSQSFAFMQREAAPGAPAGEPKAAPEPPSTGMELSSESAAPSDGPGTTPKAA